MVGDASDNKDGSRVGKKLKITIASMVHRMSFPRSHISIA
jgi:hypothetical protein